MIRIIRCLCAQLESTPRLFPLMWWREIICMMNLIGYNTMGTNSRGSAALLLEGEERMGGDSQVKSPVKGAKPYKI